MCNKELLLLFKKRLVTNRFKLSDGIVSGGQDLQPLQGVDVFDNLDTVIEEYEIFELDQCRQTFYLLYIVERQVCHDNHSWVVITMHSFPNLLRHTKALNIGVTRVDVSRGGNGRIFS